MSGEIVRRVRQVQDSPLTRTARALREGLASSLLVPDRNPVCNFSGKPSSLFFALEQYGVFSFHALNILIRARTFFSGYPSIATELDINIEEEFGKRALPPELQNVSRSIGRKATHYDIMAYGFQQLFHRKLSGQALDLTMSFVHQFGRSFMFGENQQKAAGAIYASEAVAIPGLEVFRRLCLQLADSTGFITRFEGSILDQFLRMHLDAVGLDHIDGLANALADDMEAKASTTGEPLHHNFRVGFERVAGAMKDWWIGIARNMEVLNG